MNANTAANTLKRTLRSAGHDPRNWITAHQMESGPVVIVEAPRRVWTDVKAALRRVHDRNLVDTPQPAATTGRAR